MIMTLDIGGTKTLWTIWKHSSPLAKGLTATNSIGDFTDFIRQCRNTFPVKKVILAIAGPINGNKFRLTNTDRLIDVQRLRQELPEISEIICLNDLEALAHSISYLNEPEQIVMFRPSSTDNSINAASTGAKSVISLGTGLGISAISREGIVIPSEGGHTDFAPTTSLQQSIYEKLAAKYGHVSYERLLSGQGLANIYKCLTDTDKTPAQITEAAKTGNKSALKAFDIFTEILAAVCSNFALIYMASGGVYIGGGMIAKVLPLIDKKTFDMFFTAKGRFRDFLSAIPVYVILDENAPSIGAAMYSV